jgi:Uma2 family endonuclease
MVMAGVVPRYTAAEVRRFDDPRLRFEVIRGELFVSPAPGLPHQRIVMELAALLKDYVEARRLGEVLPGPFEVEFTEDSATQPDVLVILQDRASQLGKRRMTGSPSLIVEVVSYSSKRTDRLQKRELYVAEGVGEYWILDPELRRLERWRPGWDTPEVLSERVVWQPAPAPEPLVIDLKRLFSKAWAGLA